MYRYTRLTYDLKECPVVRREEKLEMSGAELYERCGNVGEQSFLSLLHRWNTLNAGVPPEYNNLVHIYFPYWRV